MKNKILIITSLVAVFYSTFTSADDKTLDISYVKAPFNLQLMVMKEHQLLEKKMAPLNVDVKWHEITSGAKQAQALASGSLDIAGVMNTTSILLANGAGQPVKIIAGVARPTDVFAIVAAKDRANSIKELKGKTVAGPKGTVLYQTLIAALVKNDMTIDDIHFLQMDITKAFTALQSGQIDAALLSASSVIKATEESAKILTTANGLVVPLLVMASSEEVIKTHPDWIKATVEAHDEAADWIAKNQEDAIALGAKLQSISIDDAKQLYSWTYPTQRINENDIKNMAIDVQFMLDTDMLREPVDVTSIVLPEAMEKRHG